MLSIDNEDDANDENKKQPLNDNRQQQVLLAGASSITANNIVPMPAVCALKQRLLDGIEKVNTFRQSNSSENMPTTPRSTAKSRNRRVVPNSSTKKISMKKRKRKKDDESTDESDYNKASDSDDDLEL